MPCVNIVRVWPEVRGNLIVSEREHLSIPSDAIHIHFLRSDAPMVRHDILDQALDQLEARNQPRDQTFVGEDVFVGTITDEPRTQEPF